MIEKSPQEAAGESIPEVFEKGPAIRPESGSSVEPLGARPASADDGSSKAFNDVLHSEVGDSNGRVQLY
jgi:hypothetical protein